MSTETRSFQSVHDRFRPRVLRYLTRLVGEADAEDVGQSVMLKVSEGLPGFRGDSSISTWIYRIATNAAMDKLRRKSAQTMSETDFDLDGDDAPEGPQTPSVEGVFFGEIAMMEGHRRSSDAFAKGERVVLYSLREQRLGELVQRHPALGLKIYQNLGRELAARVRATSQALRALE